MSSENPEIVHANPTKDFFISMLIRDVSLKDAISDLVDNSIDGAKRLRGDIKNDSNLYQGLWVKITANAGVFIIEDNCGGIDIDVARNYAFYFGRRKNAQSTSTIGVFGIGMKRSLFKLGNQINIESKAKNSTFYLPINVSEWAKTDKWEFKFEKFEEDLEETEVKNRKTKIEVTELRQETIRKVSNQQFINELSQNIALQQMYNIHKGLKIYVNEIELPSKFLKLKYSKELPVVKWKSTFLDNEISVELSAGIGSKSLKDGGWYIFCNDRLIVGPEQSELSGWIGGKKNSGTPKYHGQYQLFRGYVFFYSENPSVLPWNTSKNGINKEDPIFIAVRQEMINVMKPIVNFLNKLKSENNTDNISGEKPLHDIIDKAKTFPLASIPENNFQEKFIMPTTKPLKFESTERIIYSKPKEQIEEAKKFFKVKDNKSVGEKTFEYFYNNEI